jgi:hypothetical protein
MRFLDRPFARKGDEAMCDEHGPTVIDEGYERFTDSEGFLFWSRIEREGKADFRRDQENFSVKVNFIVRLLSKTQLLHRCLDRNSR